MSPAEFLAASFLLGALVLVAGAYGVLYALARARGSRGWLRASYASYVLLAAVTAAIVVLTPLDWGWKALVLASCVAYFWIPRLTWTYLNVTHRNAERP